MRKGKVELKRIEDKNSRQVSFSKRRGGLFKKARELSVLCDVDVAVLVCTAKHKVFPFSAGDSSLKDVIERYQMQVNSEEASGKNLHGIEGVAKFHSEYGNCAAADSRQMALKELSRQQFELLNITEVIQLEHKLDTILQKVRTRKRQLTMEAIAGIHDKGIGVSEMQQTSGMEVASALVHDAYNQNLQNAPLPDLVGDSYLAEPNFGSDIPYF